MEPSDGSAVYGGGGGYDDAAPKTGGVGDNNGVVSLRL